MALGAEGASRFPGAVLALVVATAPVAAQTPPRLTMQGPADKTIAPIPKDALGRPCLDVEAAARRRVVNPEMVDHVVSVKNICPRLIKIKVCYTESTRCNDEEVQAYKRVDTILGTMKSISFFTYTITQR